MATEIYRVLGQVLADGTNTSNLYTVPVGAMAKVRVTVSSADSGTHQFTISVSKNGAAIANGDRVYDSIDLLENTSFTTAELTLDAGDVIRVKSDAGAATFTFQAHGTEYWTPAVGAYFDVFEGGVQSTVKLYNLEDNLSYVFYTDEDSLVRVGFRGYGPDNELAVNFPSPYERSNFVTALENARLYGVGLDAELSLPMVYIGDNTLAGASTTTTSTSTTSTTTTTTVAPGPTTTTTSTSTTSTTTTAGPPTITVDFGRLRLGGMNFKVQLYSATVEDGLATEDTLLYDPFPDDLDFYEEFTTINWTSISDAVLYSGFQKSVPVSTLEEAYVLSAQLIGGNSLYQFRMYDVTDQNNPTLLGALPTWPVPEGEDAADYPEYGKSPSISYAEVNFSGIPLYPGKSYRLEARTDYT